MRGRAESRREGGPKGIGHQRARNVIVRKRRLGGRGQPFGLSGIKQRRPQDRLCARRLRLQAAGRENSLAEFDRCMGLNILNY